MVPDQYSPNLNSQEVLDFVADERQADGAIFSGPDPVWQGYHVAGHAIESGSLSEAVGPNGKADALKLIYSVIEHWSVTEGDSPTVMVGDLEFIIPYQQQVVLTLWARLLVKDALAPNLEQKIVEAFDTYNAKNDGEAEQYITRVLEKNPDLNAGMAKIGYSFSLVKKGAAIARTEVRDATLGLYTGDTQGVVLPDSKHPEPINSDGDGYFEKRKIRVRRISAKVVSGIPPTPKDSVHQAEVQKGQSPQDIIEQIAKSEASVIECNRLARKDIRIAELVRYPEFKVVLRDFRWVLYRDRCGNEISVVVTLPVLQIRWSKIDLWAYLRYPSDPAVVNDMVERTIETCAVRAALSGAVVGVVLGNFAAALAAFKAVFQDCLVSHFEEFLKCMIPGLAMLSEEVSGWQDV